jgi:demethylmenaquinone methyltransferase/2-methoxy-6-polyprenyl-1,4-benzoquinol methylase
MSKKHQVKKMFDSIAYRYDLLNHLLSAGIDRYWRKRALELTGINTNSKLLDVACGTGDFSITAAKQGVTNIFGADLSMNMLQLFESKFSSIKGKSVQAAAEQFPFKSESFSNITVAFGVRNFYDIEKGFKSFYNSLNQNGKVTILEFRMPSRKIIKAIYKFYFKKLLPFIGRIISKDKEAYYYLPDSVEEFDQNVDLLNLLERANFKSIEKHSLTFGIVQVVIAEK